MDVVVDVRKKQQSLRGTNWTWTAHSLHLFHQKKQTAAAAAAMEGGSVGASETKRGKPGAKRRRALPMALPKEGAAEGGRGRYENDDDDAVETRRNDTPSGRGRGAGSVPSFNRVCTRDRRFERERVKEGKREVWRGKRETPTGTGSRALGSLAVVAGKECSKSRMRMTPKPGLRGATQRE